MNKTIVKICALLVLLVAGFACTSNVAYAANNKVYEGHIKGKNPEVLETKKFATELKVDVTGVYNISVDQPGENYYLNIYNNTEKFEEENMMLQMQKGSDFSKVYLEKDKTYELECDFNFITIKEFDFKISVDLVEKRTFKPELNVSVLKVDSDAEEKKERIEVKKANIKGLTYDEDTHTLTLENAKIKGCLEAQVANPGFGFDIQNLDINIVVKGNNKIISNGLCGSYLIKTDKVTNCNISGGGTLNLVSANTCIKTHNTTIENVTIKGDNFELLSYDTTIKNVKFDVSIDYSDDNYYENSDCLDRDYDIYYNSLFYNGYEEDYGTFDLTDCTLNLRYNLLPAKYLKDGGLSVTFLDYDARKFKNCEINVTIQKEMLKRYKDKFNDRFKKNKTLKVNYKTIKKSYRDYCDKGAFYITEDGVAYKVTKAASSDGKYIGSVELIGTSKNDNSKITIPDSIKIGMFAEFKVVKIHKDAVSNLKKLKKLVIGKNVRIIGKNAFAGNKKLNYVKIKSANIMRIYKGAFTRKGGKKIKFVVPKKMVKKYKRLLKKSGVKKFTVVAA